MVRERGYPLAAGSSRTCTPTHKWFLVLLALGSISSAYFAHSVTRAQQGAVYLSGSADVTFESLVTFTDNIMEVRKVLRSWCLRRQHPLWYWLTTRCFRSLLGRFSARISFSSCCLRWPFSLGLPSCPAIFGLVPASLGWLLLSSSDSSVPRPLWRFRSSVRPTLMFIFIPLELLLVYRQCLSLSLRMFHFFSLCAIPAE